MGRKRKYSSQIKNLSTVSEDVFTGQWLAGQQPGAAAAAQTCSRRKQVIQNSNAASSSEWCCGVSHAHHSSPSSVEQLSQEAPLAR